MLISPFEIYLIGILKNVDITVTVISVMLSITTLFLFIAILTIDDYSNKKENGITSLYYKYIKPLFISTIIFGTIAMLIPNTKTVAAMYLIPAIVNNEHIQNSTSNTLKMLEELTKEWLEDFIKKESKKDGVHT